MLKDLLECFLRFFLNILGFFKGSWIVFKIFCLILINLFILFYDIFGILGVFMLFEYVVCVLERVCVKFLLVIDIFVCWVWGKDIYEEVECLMVVFYVRWMNELIFFVFKVVVCFVRVLIFIFWVIL